MRPPPPPTLSSLLVLLPPPPGLLCRARPPLPPTRDMVVAKLRPATTLTSPPPLKKLLNGPCWWSPLCCHHRHASSSAPAPITRVQNHNNKINKDGQRTPATRTAVPETTCLVPPPDLSELKAALVANDPDRALAAYRRDVRPHLGHEPPPPLTLLRSLAALLLHLPRNASAAAARASLARDWALHLCSGDPWTAADYVFVLPLAFACSSLKVEPHHHDEAPLPTLPGPPSISLLPLWNHFLAHPTTSPRTVHLFLQAATSPFARDDGSLRAIADAVLLRPPPPSIPLPDQLPVIDTTARVLAARALLAAGDHQRSAEALVAMLHNPSSNSGEPIPIPPPPNSRLVADVAVDLVRVGYVDAAAQVALTWPLAAVGTARVVQEMLLVGHASHQLPQLADQCLRQLVAENTANPRRATVLAARNLVSWLMTSLDRPATTDTIGPVPTALLAVWTAAPIATQTCAWTYLSSALFSPSRAQRPLCTHLWRTLASAIVDADNGGTCALVHAPPHVAAKLVVEIGTHVRSSRLAAAMATRVATCASGTGARSPVANAVAHVCARSAGRPALVVTELWPVLQASLESSSASARTPTTHVRSEEDDDDDDENGGDRWPVSPTIVDTQLVNHTLDASHRAFATHPAAAAAAVAHLAHLVLDRTDNSAGDAVTWALVAQCALVALGGPRDTRAAGAVWAALDRARGVGLASPPLVHLAARCGAAAPGRHGIAVTVMCGAADGVGSWWDTDDELVAEVAACARAAFGSGAAAAESAIKDLDLDSETAKRVHVVGEDVDAWIAATRAERWGAAGVPTWLD
ncbi:hypothetical protein BC828DRAFT_383024 [Blastocladiella britannica]|nr:hypothetical protein BC828DRAFT_383024 [Blastocladiella britannica]